MLKELRTNRGISKVFLAKKFNIDRNRLTRIEDGKAELPARFVPILANLYNVSVSEIIAAHMEDSKDDTETKRTDRIM